MFLWWARMIRVLALFVLNFMSRDDNATCISMLCAMYPIVTSFVAWATNCMYKQCDHLLCEVVMLQVYTLIICDALATDMAFAYSFSVYSSILCFEEFTVAREPLQWTCFIAYFGVYYHACPCTMQPSTHLLAICTAEAVNIARKGLVKFIEMFD